MSAIVQVEPMTTARALRGPFDYKLPQELTGEVTVGSMLVVPFGTREILGVVTAVSDSSDVAEEKLLAPLRALDGGAGTPSPTVPSDLMDLARWLADEYCSTLARALGLMLPPAATKRLSGRKRRLPARAEHVRVGVGAAEPPPLTGEQADVLAELRGALEAGEAQTRLLAGVTGSGKTEIYLRVAAEALREGRGVIVLVPEIALTPQIVARFIARFGGTVAVLHSRLTVAQRREEWRRLRSGEARICVGPRSAVFAPIERLGLIVLDEEHDSSYKHEGDPRYDARAVAERRAHDQGALLLLGSATPRPESVHAVSGGPLPGSGSVHAVSGGPLPGPESLHAASRGLLRLARRVDGRPLPRVSVLDMCRHAHPLHPETVAALAEVRAARGKAIVLLNRRGWSNFLACGSCGHVWSCPHCDVSLVLHRASGVVACHHCGHYERVPSVCMCGSTAVARHGAGTERLQHELELSFGDDEFPIFRLDADTVGSTPGSEGGVGRLLSRFEAAGSGVLIGTQMVAKGHDFADVTLGIVLDADATLRFPDFRAEERTFALVTQLAGRVGRGNDGHVIVQTIAPEARSIVHAAAHDSDGFLAGELRRRQALRYPPFSSLIRVVCSAERYEYARAAAQALHGELSRTVGEQVELLGPATLFRLRGRERSVLMIKMAPGERARTIARLGSAVQRMAGAREHTGVSFSVDVDPQ